MFIPLFVFLCSVLFSSCKFQSCWISVTFTHIDLFHFSVEFNFNCVFPYLSYFSCLFVWQKLQILLGAKWFSVVFVKRLQLSYNNMVDSEEILFGFYYFLYIFFFLFCIWQYCVLLLCALRGPVFMCVCVCFLIHCFAKTSKFFKNDDSSLIE